MELRHLRYFVAAAEELHFHRAAQRMGIQQPPLSAQIRQLEVELGTPLFRRLTRGVVLTEAGEAMLEDARRILAAVDKAKLEMSRRVRGDTGRLNVGFASGTPFNSLLPQTVKAFRDTYPAVEISPTLSSSQELAHSVGEGACDVAFVNMPMPPVNGVSSVKLIRERWVIAVPSDHALAQRKSTPLSALAGEPVLTVARGRAPLLFDLVFAMYERAGFTPRLGQVGPSVPALIGMVSVGMGVAIVPQSHEQIRPPGVAYVGIEDEFSGSHIGLIWRRDNMPTTVHNFIDLARRLAAEHGEQVSQPEPAIGRTSR